MPSILCPRCGEQHDGHEPGFRWPDAVFALSLPQEERALLQDGENEDVAVVRSAYFVRAAAFIPVHGWSETASIEEHGEPCRAGAIALGFWVQISASDFADFESRKRVDHMPYGGRVANQSMYLAPTLGLACRLDFRGEGWRPAVTFLDPSHPLTHAQRTGISQATVAEWIAEVAHAGEPEPAREPFLATFEAHGFEIIDPHAAGRETATLTSAPANGDTVKVFVSCAASNEVGDTERLNAGWWVRLDDLSRDAIWGGTLASHTRVPVTIALGSRIWIRPSDLLEHAPA